MNKFSREILQILKDQNPPSPPFSKGGMPAGRQGGDLKHIFLSNR